MLDWLHTRDVQKVYYNGSGKIQEWIEDVISKHEDILNGKGYTNKHDEE